MDEAGVHAIAAAQVEKILSMKPDAVLCQGEMTLSYQVIRRLLQAGILVVAACSERIVTELESPDGGRQKLSRFHFCRFRAYDAPCAAKRE